MQAKPNNESVKSKVPYHNYHSPGAWEAVKNSSWGEEHKKIFSDKSGFVICVKSTDNETVAIASVCGYFGQEQKQVMLNAELIASAPNMLKFIKDITLLEENNFHNINELIETAKTIIAKIHK